MNLKKFSSKGYEKLEEGNLQVGDVVIVRNNMGGTHIYEIDAVTKTMGKCNVDNGRYIQRFRLDIWGIKSLPADTWDTNDYTVYRKVEETNEQ